MESPEATQLIQKKKTLIQNYLAGHQGDLLEELTRILDSYFIRVYENSIAARKLVASGNPFALIALGGYGRREQCIHSDIDLLVLFGEQVPAEVEAFVQELLYPLWDRRFEVGYALRHTDECIAMAFERFDILTTVLDARFICGASHIYTAFMEKFRVHLTTRHLKSTLTHLLEHGSKRLEDFGDSTYLVDPDLKSGLGGLRDYHSLMWYARIKSNIRSRRDLEYYGFLSHDEYQTLEQALSYIWDIRNRLHHITGRKCDTLHFEYQAEMAGMLNARTPGRRHQDVEAFLGALHGHMEFLKQINQITMEDIQDTRRARKESGFPRRSRTYGLVIKKRRLYFANTVIILQHPDLLLRIFLESGQSRIPLSIEARRIISEFLHLVDDPFRNDPQHIRVFRRILSLSFWEFNVLNVMLSTGLLQQFIPEFAAIRNKIQYNQYHIFPVDKHSIRCVQILNSFRTAGPDPESHLYANVFSEIRNKHVLLLAGLLHDIGKSDPAREHSRRGARIAAGVVTRMGFSGTESSDIVFLIENHLLLAKTATRRDIYDEETAVQTANKIEKIRWLRMLFLLTVADSMATGPKAWNDWTETLIKDLFLKVLRILKTGELASKKSHRLIEQKKKGVLACFSQDQGPEELNHLLEAMPQRYLLNMPPVHIVEHINLYRNLGVRDFIWQISRDDTADMRTIAICGKDRPGLYSKIAGVFFLNHINIIASQAYCMDITHVLDIFRVTPPVDRLFEQEKWEKAEKDLNCALADDHFLDTALSRIPRTLTIDSGQNIRETRVRIDNTTSSFFTIVEVLTYDFPGLLFTITDALYRSGVNVNIAMAGTKIDQVIDIFYVRDLIHDRKIEDPQKLELLKKAIITRLPSVHAKEIANEKN